MLDERGRTRAGREAAESALVRVVHHHGSRPGFVVLGGLVPGYLCSTSGLRHAGTIDVDVQVDLEIARGSRDMRRLEAALRRAGFAPDSQRAWRWKAVPDAGSILVELDLLADLDDQPFEANVLFDECEELGALNLRGTGFACRDVSTRRISARVDEVDRSVEVDVTGLAGFLLAKCAAAHARRLPKDWYDIAFVLLHNDAGGPEAAALDVLGKFGPHAADALWLALDDLVANFADHRCQGPTAYAMQMMLDHEGLDATTLRADAIIAIETFHEVLVRA